MSTKVLIVDLPDIAADNAAIRYFRSPLRYPGGKQKAIQQIAGMFPDSMKEYREPMVGGGSVFLYLKTFYQCEKYWINDKFKELISFWQSVKSPATCRRLARDLEELRQSFDSSPKKIKKYFYSAREELVTSRYREAFLFFFFNRVTFSGTTQAGGFSSAASLLRFTASSIERLKFLPKALENTNITNLDFEQVIKAPGEDVFIFLDPPYATATRLYGRNGDLHNFNHKHLAKVLKKTKHKFLITYDDCKEIRSLYSDWANIKEWKLQYGMNNCNRHRQSKVGNEIFIYNYSIS